MYLIISDKSLSLSPVTIRATSAAGKLLAKFHAATLALREAGDAATDEQREAVATLSRKAKGPVKFVPAEGAKVTRYTVTDAMLAAYRAATDAKGRKAAIADAASNEQASAIHPSVFVTDAMVAAYGSSDALLADCAAGTLVLPSPGRGNAVAAAKLTPEQRTAAAVAALFGSADADATDAATDAA